MGSVVREKGGEVPEEEVTYEAHSRVYREGEGKKGRPQRNSRKKDVGSKNETRQKSHHERCNLLLAYSVKICSNHGMPTYWQ